MPCDYAAEKVSLLPDLKLREVVRGLNLITKASQQCFSRLSQDGEAWERRTHRVFLTEDRRLAYCL